MRDSEIIPSFRRLQAFDGVARTGSLSAAAQALRLSQPALTHSIGQLESQLGTRLFERGPEGTFLNGAGQILQRRVQRFFAQIVDAVAHAAGRPADDPALEALSARIGSAQVRSLLAIWRAGSFRAAAASLGLAEPSLQRPARELERVLGASLYRRSAAGLGVNEAGGELARRLALALGEIRSGAEEIGAAAQSRASLRIGVLALAPRILLARATGPLLAHHRQHKIEVIEAPYLRLARDLNDGALDLVLGALRDPPPYADLLEEKFFEDPYAIVCRHDHPLTRLALATPADLARYEWIFPTRDLPRRQALDALMLAWALPQNVQFETSCLTTITAMLSTSDCISILSRWHIELDGRSQLARIQTPVAPDAPRHVGITIRKNWLPTPFQADFLAHLRAAAQGLGARA